MMVRPDGSRTASIDDWFTVAVLEFTVGMVIFFALAIVVTDMRDEGERARNVMVAMTVLFSAVAPILRGL